MTTGSDARSTTSLEAPRRHGREAPLRHGDEPPSPQGRPRRRLPRPGEFGLVGIIVGLMFVWASLSPSLLPRGPILQGVVSGVAGAVGYGLGSLLGAAARRVLRRDPSRRTMRIAWQVTAVVGPLVTAVLLFFGARWQLRVHRLLDVPPPHPPTYLVTIVLVVVAAVALIQLARGVRWLARRTTDLLDRHLARGLAEVLSVIAVVVLLVLFADGVLGRAFFWGADAFARAVDQAMEEDLGPPASPLRSGGPGSLVAWEDLGAKGRHFVATGPTTEDLEATTGREVLEPIRVYIGLASAETDRERAELAVAELERVGAADRSVVVLAIPTGTGWLDPKPADSLEYLHAGDTAIVAAQYSYLPSWLSFLVDVARAREAGRIVFNEIHEWWEELPEDARPRLVVFGESLGSLGAEGAFSSEADLRNRTDGALFIGPPNSNELWREFVAHRDPGSPERLPVYDGGETVRFAARAEDLWRPGEDWETPRVVYLQQASDPVVWWTPRVILRQPDWLREPRGEDVLGDMQWFPVVTFVQLSVDLLNGYTIDTEGYGHRYGDVTIDAWLAVAPPEDWDDADRPAIEAALEWAGNGTGAG
jgi:uncharacterized membrane protein